uniref:Uncharacterized protein n=1 Tax=Cucumis melo TaxID=3656 RepID=A0A9I9EIP3_CUCME
IIFIVLTQFQIEILPLNFCPPITLLSVPSSSSSSSSFFFFFLKPREFLAMGIILGLMLMQLSMELIKTPTSLGRFVKAYTTCLRAESGLNHLKTCF